MVPWFRINVERFCNTYETIIQGKDHLRSWFRGSVVPYYSRKVSKQIELRSNEMIEFEKWFRGSVVPYYSRKVSESIELECNEMIDSESWFRGSVVLY